MNDVLVCKGGLVCGADGQMHVVTAGAMLVTEDFLRTLMKATPPPKQLPPKEDAPVRPVEAAKKVTTPADKKPAAPRMVNLLDRQMVPLADQIATPVVRVTTPPVDEPTTLSQRILAVVDETPREALEIADILDEERIHSVSALLRNLSNRGQVEKVGRGLFKRKG